MPAPSNEPTRDENHGRQFFYLVSKKKFLLFVILSHGLYFPYWMYRHWRQYLESSDGTALAVGRSWWFNVFLMLYGHFLPGFVTRPLKDGAPLTRAVLRGIFFFCYLHSLAERINGRLSEAQLAVAGNVKMQASFLLGTIFIFQLMPYVLVFGPIGFLLLILLDAGCVVAAALIAWPIQQAANLAESDPAGRRNATLSVANYVWLTLGVMFWLYLLINLVGFLFRLKAWK